MYAYCVPVILSVLMVVFTIVPQSLKNSFRSSSVVFSSKFRTNIEAWSIWFNWCFVSGPPPAFFPLSPGFTSGRSGFSRSSSWGCIINIFKLWAQSPHQFEYQKSYGKPDQSARQTRDSTAPTAQLSKEPLRNRSREPRRLSHLHQSSHLGQGDVLCRVARVPPRPQGQTPQNQHAGHQPGPRDRRAQIVLRASENSSQQSSQSRLTTPSEKQDQQEIVLKVTFLTKKTPKGQRQISAVQQPVSEIISTLFVQQFKKKSMIDQTMISADQNELYKQQYEELLLKTDEQEKELFQLSELKNRLQRQLNKQKMRVEQNKSDEINNIHLGYAIVIVLLSFIVGLFIKD